MDKLTIKRLLIGAMVFHFGIQYISFAIDLTNEEKARLKEEVVVHQNRIENIHARFMLLLPVDDKPSNQIWYEWAKSGKKEYRKRGMPTPMGQPLSDRYGIAVWDGKFLKSYDSAFNSGTLRNKYDPRDPESPTTHSAYSRQFGTLDMGTLADLLKDSELNSWDFTWAPEGGTLVLSHSRSTLRREWTLDPEKGYMIVGFVSSVLDFQGNVASTLTMEVSESKEVKPGIWLPTKSKTIGNYAGGKVIRNDILVKDIIVNDPSIEKLFDWSFPEGSQYYDHVIGQAIVPHLTEKAIQQELANMADDISIEPVIGSVEANEVDIISITEPPKEVFKKMDKDDFEVADELIRSSPGSLGTGGRRFLSAKVLICVFSAIVAIGLFYLVYLKHRHGNREAAR